MQGVHWIGSDRPSESGNQQIYSCWCLRLTFRYLKSQHQQQIISRNRLGKSSCQSEDRGYHRVDLAVSDIRLARLRHLLLAV